MMDAEPTIHLKVRSLDILKAAHACYPACTPYLCFFSAFAR
jgi:hypothetical protein